MRSLFALVLVLISVGCGPSGVGSECYYSLSSDGCVEGAFCTPGRSTPVAMGQDPTWDAPYCRVICDEADDCPLAEECRSVVGAERVRTCQPIDLTP